jgi:hypothetical protein
MEEARSNEPYAPTIHDSIEQTVAAQLAAIATENGVVGVGGGRRRIRTSVGYAGDFTDRSLWPLGHPPGT